MLDQDPIAQRHMAKINKYRGEYDQWGNRLTRSYLNVRHLLEDPGKPARFSIRHPGHRDHDQSLQEEERQEQAEETATPESRGGGGRGPGSL